MNPRSTSRSGGLSRACGTGEFSGRFGKRPSLAAFIAFATAIPVFAGPPTAPADADWKQDAPGVRHKYTERDLPAPYASKSVDNGPREVPRPAGAEPRVPAGFKIEQF